MLVGGGRMATVAGAWLANTSRILALKRAIFVQLGNIQFTSMQQTISVLTAQQDHTHTITGLCACHVLKTHFPQTRERTSQHVHAMLGGLEPLMTAKAVCLENSNPILGLKRAIIAPPGNIQFTSMQQATHARIAQRDHTHTRTGLCACHVLKTHFPQTGVRTSQHVHAMLGGLEPLMTAEAACLENSNPMLGLNRALIATPENIQFTSMQQAMHARIAQRGHTHTITGLCACHVLTTHFHQTG